MQPTRIEHQQEPLMNHSVSHGWTTRPAAGRHVGSSDQHSGQIPMNQNTPFVLSPGPIPTPYHRPQVRSSHPKPTYVPAPAMKTPSSAPMPPTYIQNVPAQPPNVNALHPAGYQSHSQPPQTDHPSLSTNTADQHQYPRVNNDNTVNPASVAPGATRSAKKSRRGNGRGNGKRRAEGSSEM